MFSEFMEKPKGIPSAYIPVMNLSHNVLSENTLSSFKSVDGGASRKLHPLNDTNAENTAIIYVRIFIA